MKERRYLSRKEVGERIGVKPDSMSRWDLPEPDAVVGRVRGWLPGTIDRWWAGPAARPAAKAAPAAVSEAPGDDARVRVELPELGLPEAITEELARDLADVGEHFAGQVTVPERFDDPAAVVATIYQIDSWAHMRGHDAYKLKYWAAAVHVIHRHDADTLARRAV